MNKYLNEVFISLEDNIIESFVYELSLVLLNFFFAMELHVLSNMDASLDNAFSKMDLKLDLKVDALRIEKNL